MPTNNIPTNTTSISGIKEVAGENCYEAVNNFFETGLGVTVNGSKLFQYWKKKPDIDIEKYTNNIDISIFFYFFER